MVLEIKESEETVECLTINNAEKGQATLFSAEFDFINVNYDDAQHLKETLEYQLNNKKI